RVVSLLQAANSIGQLVTLRPDTTPPTVPSNLAQTASTASSISLNWSASSDNVMVSGYTLYQGSNAVATVSGTSYTLPGLTCGTSYPLSVDAFDAAGNYSGQANLSVTTAVCPQIVVNSAPVATVSLSSATPDTNATVTATVVASDADGDPISLTYVWSVNGN